MSPGLIRELEKHTHPFLVKKNKFILSPLDNNMSIYFIVNGLVRGFIKDDMKDITTWFSFGNQFVSAIQQSSLETGVSTFEYLQALEDTELIEVPYSLLYWLYEIYPESNIIGRKILSLQCQAASNRSILARIPSAERRYERFLQQNKYDFSRVPLRCLASYLCMRLETLSRIRSRILKEAC